MSIYRLGDIAAIQIGLVLARRKARDGLQYPYRRLSLKSLRNDGTINPGENERFYSSTQLDESFLTRPGTIIMKLFAPLNPALVTEETAGFVIPSQMAAITVHHDVLPEYVRIYLSQKSISDRLLSNNTGIVLRTITITTLLNLELEVPSYKNQRLICDYCKNYHQKQTLRDALEAEEQKMMRHVFSLLSKDRKELSI
jgi:restriction endonuclease S subunit